MVCEYPEDSPMVSPAVVEILKKMNETLNRVCVAIEYQSSLIEQSNKKLEEEVEGFSQFFQES